MLGLLVVKPKTLFAGLRARLLTPFFGLCLIASVARATEYYASPTASVNGTGTFSNPWKLQTALDQPAAVQPGDTIWLRGGTYTGRFTSYLNGTSAQPIVVRQYTGERATIDGGASGTTAIFTVYGSYTWFWGFEVTSSDPDRSTSTPGSSPPDITRGDGIEINQTITHPGLKFINLVVHDTRQGFSYWKEAQDAEIYGSLIYYNGWNAPDGGHGHGIYAQNQTGTKKITDNILFSGFAYGFHAYTEGSYIDNLDLEGNTTFNAGNLTGTDRNLLIGGINGIVAHNPIIQNNSLYREASGSDDLNLGLDGSCSNATLTNNYIANGTALDNCLPTTMTGNTFYGSISGFTQSQYPSNTYYSSRPTGVKVFIRPNAYEAGRVNVTIFNWDNLDSVAVDLSGILSVGSTYEIRNAQNFFGPAVASRTYDGAPVSFPMTGLSPATPVGWAAPSATGPEFNAFILTMTLAPGEFYDVPQANIFHDSIHTIALDGITAGCRVGYYCPDNPVSRAEMAVFLLKSKHGAAYAPPPASGGRFDDVPAGSFAADWIEELAAEDITAGCTLQDYCPDASASRAQMAVFLLRALLGAGYTPPPATGSYFTDVPAGAFAAAWIEDLAARGITAGCGGGKYCPDNPVSRGEMAVFLVTTFNLQ